jgi:hypothetical protein
MTSAFFASVAGLKMIRGASSRVSSLAADRRPASCRLWAKDFFTREGFGNRLPHDH